jgi:hypothetical protein
MSRSDNIHGIVLRQAIIESQYVTGNKPTPTQSVPY